MRKTFELKIEQAKETCRGKGDEKNIYDEICGKVKKLGENSPHNILLKEANFAYFQDRKKSGYVVESESLPDPQGMCPQK